MSHIELSPVLEKQFFKVVHDSYEGNPQEAIAALLRLHQKYGWKEQFRQNVDSVRAEVRRRGGIRSEDIDDAIKKYRKTAGCSDV